MPTSDHPESDEVHHSTPIRRSFWQRWLAATRLDATVYHEVEDDPSAILQAFSIVAIAGLARGLAAVANDDLVGVAGSLVIAFSSWFIVTALLWFVGVVIDRDTSGFFELMRTVGFAASPLVLLCVVALPFVSAPTVVLGVKIVTHVAAAAALVIAAREALDVSTLRAGAICGLVIGVLAIVVVYLLNALALRLQGILDVVVSAASQT
jgi:hypothetical protein